MPKESFIIDKNVKASSFKLKNIDNQYYSLDKLYGKNGMLVMFICNHCPYVKAVIDKIVRDAKNLNNIGINSVAIMSNDPNEYEEDSFENMKKISKELNFPFPYLIDETQEIAKSYGAVCTPDFFGYNKDLGLQYRGRLDESRKESVINARRDLFEAMKNIAITGNGPKEQTPSMGCSIKWFD